MPDYDLGKAHGRIVIDYDSKGTDQAQEEFENVEEAAGKLHGVFEKLRKFFKFFTGDFGDSAKKWSAAFGILAGGTAILLGMTGALGRLNGGMLKLRGGMNVLRSVSILFGGLPKSVQGFPKIIKQIIKLSAAITLLAQSSRLLNTVFVNLGRMAAGTRIVQTLTNAFPGLTAQIKRLASFIPSIATVGNTIDKWSRPIHQVARMALTIGTLISLWKSGTKAAWALAKGIGAIGLAGAALQALIVLTSGLVDATLELSGALGLIPGIYASIGAIKGTLAVGLAGFKDAMKHLDDAEKFEEAIKDMAPAAQNAARAIRGLKDTWLEMQRNVQQQLFQGVAKEIKRLAAIYIPLMREQMGLLAIDLNHAAKEVSKFAQRGSTIKDVNKIFEGSRTIVQNLSKAIQPFLRALLDIVVVSQEVFADLTADAGEAADAFANFIHEARETGRLREWIEDGITAMFRLGDIVVNITRIFKTIFDAFDTGGGGFLLMLNRMTDRMLAFLQSAKGQEALQTVVELISTLADATRAVLKAGFSELIPILVSLLPLIRDLAKVFSTVLVAAIKILGPILESLAKVLSALSPVIAPILGAFLALSIASKVLLGGLGLLFKVIFGGIAAINALATVIRILGAAALANPVLAFFGLLAAAILIVITNWDKFAPVLKAIWEWIKNVAITVWTAIVDFITGIWDAVTGFLKRTWEGIADIAKTVWNSIIDFFVGIWDSVTGFFKRVWTSIANFLTRIWKSIVESTRPIWEPIVSIIQSVISIIKDLFIIVFGGIAIAFIQIWKGIQFVVVEVWTAIVSFLQATWNFILTIFHALWDPLVEFFTFIWSGITNVTTAAWTNISNFFTTIWTSISNFATTIWTNISNFFTNIWNKIKNTVVSAWTAAMNFFQARLTAAGNFFRNIWNNIASFFSNIWNSRIVTAVRNGVSNVVNWVGSLPGKIWNFFKDAGQWLINAGKAVIEGFLNGLKSAFQAVADWVGGVADWVADHKGPLDKDRVLLIPAGEAIMQGLLNGLMSKETVIKRFLQGLSSDIAGGLDGANKQLAGAAGEIAGSATLGIVTKLPTNARAVASLPRTNGTGANGLPASPGAPGAPLPAPINIDTLILQVTGNLDPTDPVRWDNAMKRIKDGIRGVQRANQ